MRFKTSNMSKSHHLITSMVPYHSNHTETGDLKPPWPKNQRLWAASHFSHPPSPERPRRRSDVSPQLGHVLFLCLFFSSGKGKPPSLGCCFFCLFFAYYFFLGGSIPVLTSAHFGDLASDAKLIFALGRSPKRLGVKPNKCEKPLS